MEREPPNARDVNDNIHEERWTHVSLEGVRFPSNTIDVVKRGEALANFERELVIHCQQISKEALYAKTLLGGVRRALEITAGLSLMATIGRRPPQKRGGTTMPKDMVALKSMNIPPEAWQCVKLLRSIPSCRLIIMAAYHYVSPSVSTEEASLMNYLQSPPDAGPRVGQVTVGRQNWKWAGRRLVEIGGRLPTANALQTSFTKILSKHLSANKKVSFAFQQKSSLVPTKNPSPVERLDLFTVVLVGVTLVQYSMLTGHLPGDKAANTEVKRKKVNKVEVAQEEPRKEEPQVNTVNTPRPKSKGPGRGYPPTLPNEETRSEAVRPWWQGQWKREEREAREGKPTMHSFLLWKAKRVIIATMSIR